MSFSLFPWSRLLTAAGLPLLGLAASGAAGGPGAPADWRDVRTGSELPRENYADQPYVVVTNDGAWLCVLTTGRGTESKKGQHVVATISEDQGRTWSPLIDIEPAEAPMSSWVMPLLVPRTGRVYVFYNVNIDNLDLDIPSILGAYCYRWSDDGGRTWSKERQRLPIRMTKVDRENNWQGKVQLFWGIGKPIVGGDTAYLAFTRCGRYVVDNSEGWFFRSDNILTENDPSKIEWRLLPDGDVGLRDNAHGPIQSEQNIVALSDGTLYCMYRTVQGYPCHAYSYDRAKTWTRPVAATYTPETDRHFRNPRACPRIWRTKNGNFLFWFHNHGGKDYSSRNPAWVSGGVEKDGRIHWSEPEILLYHPDPPQISPGIGTTWVGMSYPDLVEQDGRYWVTTTQKDTATVHEIDRSLLEGTWNQGRDPKVTREGLAVEATGEEGAGPMLPHMPVAAGFSVDVRVTFDSLEADQVLLEVEDASGGGLRVTTTPWQTVRLEFTDATRTTGWDCDPGRLEVGRTHEIVFIVEGGARIITSVVDGRFCDGLPDRQYGWTRFEKGYEDFGPCPLRAAPALKGRLHEARVYARPLRTFEAVANCLAAR